MARTRADLVARIQRRLNDERGAFWSRDDITSALHDASRELASATRLFWDMRYAENFPRGFSYTAVWELAYVEVFDYGVANYTLEDERRLVVPESGALGPGNHTSPFEVTEGWLSTAQARATIPATAELPDTVIALDRVLWDGMPIVALTPLDLSRLDSRYQLTQGDVYGYSWQQDGVRTFRKVRVPAAQAASCALEGSTWGSLRDPSDLTGAEVVAQ